MTDDLKRLKHALDAATPAPDAVAKAAALDIAARNFTTLQESTHRTRQKNNRPEKPAGFLTGVVNMFARTGLRPALYATSSLAVVGLGILIVLPMDGFSPVPDLAVRTGTIGKTREQVKPDTEAMSEPVLELMVQEPDMAYDMTRQAPAPAPSTMARAKSAEAPVAALIADGYDDGLVPQQDRERFPDVTPNALKITSDNPVSTFSIDVDTASYSYVRSSIMNGALPDPDAVRIEEMINYFPYDYQQPGGDIPFSTSVSVFPTPWNAGTKLVHIGIQGEKPLVENRPPLDLVFLIDTSGSMQDANKLPLLKQSFRLLLSRLSAQDRISMVTYAGSSGVVLEPTSAGETGTILTALDRLDAGGSTAGHAGLQLAYAQAEKMHADGRIGRVLLATDGDFNVGISDPEALESYIAKKRESGTYLSVLGFGRGNYNDALMQSLAQNGNGTAAYIDTLSEAQKVLVDQVSGALFPIADDVKIQVEFNPAMIAEYRLIGYETRVLAREDFNNDRVDAGDIGAGHTVTALYEVTPVGSSAIINDPLRYQQAETTTGSGEFGFLKLRYKQPGESVSRLISTPISSAEIAPTSDALFAGAMAGFGQLLRDGKYLGDWKYADAIALANSAKGADEFGYRAEAITLMRLADTLSR